MGMITDLSTTSRTNSTVDKGNPPARLSHHKGSLGSAVLSSSAFEMDEFAPFRLAVVLLAVICSVAFWAAYKMFCEGEEPEETYYQPLSFSVHERSHRQHDEEWAEVSSSSEDSAFLPQLSPNSRATAVQ